MRLRYFWILASVIWLQGCIEDVKELQYPEGSFKLFVYSSISPQDSIIKVSVKKVLPYFNNSKFYQESVKDAQVILSDGTKNITLKYTFETINTFRQVADISSYRVASKNFQIEGGKTYYLTVEAPGYPSVKAECTVPTDLIWQSTKRLEEIPYDTLEKWRPIEVVWKVTNPAIVHVFNTLSESKKTNVLTPGDTQSYLTINRVGDILYPKIENELLKVTYYNYNQSLPNTYFQKIIKQVSVTAYDDVMFRHGYYPVCTTTYRKIKPSNNIFIERSAYRPDTPLAIYLNDCGIDPRTIEVYSNLKMLRQDQYSIDYMFGKITLLDTNLQGLNNTYRWKFNDCPTSPIDPAAQPLIDTTFNFEENLFSEPIDHYTNINGGVGLFWAYNKSIVKIE